MLLFLFPADLLSLSLSLSPSLFLSQKPTLQKHKEIRFDVEVKSVNTEVGYVKLDMCRAGDMLVYIRPGELGHVWTLLGTMFTSRFEAGIRQNSNFSGRRSEGSFYVIKSIRIKS